MSKSNSEVRSHFEEYFSKFDVPVKLVFDEEELQVALPLDGILLIHASWSGHSIQNMSRIFRAILDHGIPYPSVVVADIDGLSLQTMNRLIGRQAQGHAEGVLLRNGKAVAVHGMRADFERFLAALRRIEA